MVKKEGKKEDGSREGNRVSSFAAIADGQFRFAFATIDLERKMAHYML